MSINVEKSKQREGKDEDEMSKNDPPGAQFCSEPRFMFGTLPAPE